MKKLILGVLLLFILNNAFGQYNYGIDVCNQDARIDGKLDISSLGENLFVGTEAGINILPDTSVVGNQTGLNNLFLGFQAGKNNVNSHSNITIGNRANWLSQSSTNNVFIGHSAGVSNDGDSNVFIGILSGSINKGIHNTFIGYYSGGNNPGGSNNTYVGWNSGNQSTGSNNVFIGNNAGSNTAGFNKLYIENSNSDEPLIYGEFDNNKIQINGSMKITEFANLQPRSDAPEEVIGTIYYDSDDNKVKVWTGAAWENLN